jgi:hypothetical protein
MRAVKQADSTKHIVYVRQFHCDCSSCREYNWENCANKELTAAQWVQHDITQKAKENNKANEDVVTFYSKEWYGMWNKNGLMVIALEFDGLDPERLVLAELLSPPYKNDKRTGTISIKLSETETVRIKVHRYEYVVRVKVLAKTVGNYQPHKYEYQNAGEIIIVPGSCIYLDIEDINRSFNTTNLNYIDVQLDDTSSPPTIVIKNYRKWSQDLLYKQLTDAVKTKNNDNIV